MLRVIKGLLYRMVSNKTFIVMPLVLTPIVIAVAIYFSSSFAARFNIGVVGMENAGFKSNEVNIAYLDSKVPLSDLVKNKYDAVISIEDGKIKVDTIKGNDYKSKLEKMLKGETINIKDGEQRGVAANIIGFLTMFELLGGIMLFRFFFDDKKGIAKRIISSNISYGQYVTSHFASVLIMIFVPTVVVTVLSKLLLNLNTNVSIVQLVFIVFVLSLLSAAFGLIVSTVVNDLESASLLGFMISMITTLLAGSFFTVTNNKFINNIGNLLPQKHLLDYTISLENHNLITYGNLINVIIVSLAMIISSLLITRYKIRRCGYL